MVKKFLNYVEIRTKITSTITFAMTIGFLLYQGETLDWKRTLVFFLSMFFFDLTTTAINNYIDTKDKENAQVLDFDRRTSLIIIYCLFAVSTVLGLFLAYLSDIVILAAGGICFLCGVLYTYGPVPISRQPLGEILSGFFYGVMIPFILMYINTPAGTFLSYQINLQTISLEFQVMPMITLFLFSVIPFCTTANIMLANNICDMEKDIKVRRFTLPYYIGEKALSLFAGLYYATYAAVVIMVILKILSPICLLSLVSIIPVQKNIKLFFEKQDKAVTFVCAIKNFVLIMGTNTIVIFLSLFF
ncbi:UbiA family prenyltransferase [Konateibacter massiliensis]|uniref:UbiA family prenyltransferase n=1 Tax=Konateibacter massiliensis TaxID=2002841 RepID=UPI000C155E64|nr:UbiA family prenyltransferase [Konateibacter massiliensis]